MSLGGIKVVFSINSRWMIGKAPACQWFREQLAVVPKTHCYNLQYEINYYRKGLTEVLTRLELCEECIQSPTVIFANPGLIAFCFLLATRLWFDIISDTWETWIHAGAPVNHGNNFTLGATWCRGSQKHSAGSASLSLSSPSCHMKAERKTWLRGGGGGGGGGFSSQDN